MRKGQALVDYLLSVKWVKPENIQIDPIIDDFNSDVVYLNAATGVICFYDLVYSAAIRIERFPRKRYDNTVVLSKISAWLAENDPKECRRKISAGQNGEAVYLENPLINIAPESNETFSIDIIVEFREPCFGISDVNGNEEFAGKKYRFADPKKPDEDFELDFINGRI
jgi:hypothetical protein